MYRYKTEEQVRARAKELITEAGGTGWTVYARPHPRLRLLRLELKFPYGVILESEHGHKFFALELEVFSNTGTWQYRRTLYVPRTNEYPTVKEVVVARMDALVDMSATIFNFIEGMYQWGIKHSWHNEESKRAEVPAVIDIEAVRSPKWNCLEQPCHGFGMRIERDSEVNNNFEIKNVWEE